MADMAEHYARQLMEKTKDGKLTWSFVPYAKPAVSPIETYRAELEDISFEIRLEANGDDKRVTFELTGPEGVVFSVQADNTYASSLANSAAYLGQTTIFRATAGLGWRPIGAVAGERFRLFMDLFYAAKSASGDNVTLKRAEQLLRKLG